MDPHFIYFPISKCVIPTSFVCEVISSIKLFYLSVRTSGLTNRATILPYTSLHVGVDQPCLTDLCCYRISNISKVPPQVK